MRVTNGLKMHTMTGSYIYYGTDHSVPVNGSINLGPFDGTYKSISTDQNSGKFVPGQFRVNPITIKSAFGEITPGSLFCYKKIGGTVFQIDIDGCYVLLPYDTGWNIPSLMLYGTWNDTLARRCLTRAYARKNKANVETGVILGELMETLELIRHPLRSLSRGLKSIFRANSLARTAKSAVTTVSNEWLKLQYGILPAIKDVQNIQAQFHKDVSYHTDLLRRASAKEILIQDSVMTYNRLCNVIGANFGPVPLQTRLQAFTMTKVTCCSTVYYQHLLNMEAATMARTWGLSPDQVLTTFWQLVPYSFVVDWFVDVGNWLRAISPSHEFVVLGNSTSQKTTVDSFIVDVGIPMYNGDWPCTVRERAKFTWHSETLIRQCNDTLPAMPVWTGEWIKFQNLVNSLAMIWQRGHRFL